MFEVVWFFFAFKVPTNYYHIKLNLELFCLLCI